MECKTSNTKINQIITKRLEPFQFLLYSLSLSLNLSLALGIVIIGPAVVMINIVKRDQLHGLLSLVIISLDDIELSERTRHGVSAHLADV